MPSQPRRAVVVSLEADRLCPMLLRAGYLPALRTEDAGRALAAIRDRPCDLMLADLVLPGADGVSLAERVRRLRLNVQPAIVLLRAPGFPAPDPARLDRLGVALLDKPLTASALLDAAQRRAPLPPEKAARLNALLDALGIPAHPGRKCLACAVSLAWGDRRLLNRLRDGLYPLAARQAGVTPAQAERAMRHVIDAAWRTGEMEQQHKIFGDTIDAKRGRPTCGEMIAQLADILRWEGQ